MTRKGKHPRVYQKHGAWYYVTLPERKWIRLGKTETEALAALAKIKEQDERPSAGTLQEQFARYAEEVIPTKAPRTQIDNKAELKNLSRAFGHMRPQDVTPQHVYAYRDARGRTSKTRANREKSLFSAIFSEMIHWGVVSDNPCKQVKMFTEPRRTRYVEDWEYRAVFDLASPVMKAALEIAVTTGMRQGDILKLRYSDLTESGIAVTQNKTGKKQIFEWTESLRDALKLARSHNRRADSAVYIIANERGQQYTSSGFKTNWQKLINKAMETGVIAERFRFNDLRSKAASDHDQGDRLLGHQDPKTTRKHYERKPTKVKPIR